MAINQLYLIKSGQNSFVEETEALLGISGGNIGFGTVNPESYVHITGDTKIDGDLTVQGDFRTVNQTTIQIDDKNIELGVGAVTDQDVDGGGITLRGLTDKTINWQASNNAWNLNTSLSVGGSGFFESGVFINGQPVALRSQISERIWESHPRYVNNIYNVSISGDGNNYLFSEDFIGADPSLKLFLGEAVIFDNIGGGHTLAIKDSEGNNVVNESNNKTNFIPSSTGVYTYYCESHPSSMQGEINVYNYKEISYNYGNVGIGTINPSFDLDVLGEGNFSKGLYVSGNPVLTGTAEDLGKWEDGTEAGEIFYNAGNVGIGTDNPSYNLEVKGSGNFSEGLYVNGNSVLTGSASDLGKWEDGAEAGEIFYNAGNVGIGTDNPSVNLDIVGKAQVSESFSVSNIFSIDDQGRVGGQTPFSNDVIQWDGLKWVAAQSAGGGSNGGGEVPSAFLYNLSSGESIQQVSFGQTFNVIPGIATNLEINGEGSIIPYIISGLSTSGYNAVFAKKIPNNNYRIHTVFGGTVQESSALTGKWEDSATAGEIYYNGGNVGIGTIDPAYSLHVNGTIYNENGGINVANKFNVSTLGAVGGQSPDFNEVIKWDGTKWIAGSAPGGGATSSSEAPSAFDTWLNQGSAIQAISFVDAPEGGYQSIPSISTDVEIIEGDIIPYAISGVSTTGYYAVFSDPIPTANNYKIHTTFGGKEVYWQTGAGGSSIYYDGDDVSVDNLTVGGNLTVNGTQTIVNTETVEIEDHNLVIAANTGHNQLTAEYPGAGGAYAGILWGTGDAGAASPVSLTYQSNKGFAFEGGNVGIGTTNPVGKLEVVDAVNGDVSLVVYNNDTTSGSGLQTNSIDFKFARTGSSAIKRTGAKIVAGKEQEWDSTSLSQDGYLELHTTNNTNSVPAMRISSAGNVGIGTTNPRGRLDIIGKQVYSESANNLSTSVSKSALAVQGASDAGAGLFVGVETSDALVYLQGSNGNGSAAVDLLLQPFGGNVGIGTTDPSKQLHIEDTNANTPGIKISASDQNYEHELRAGGDGVIISADSTNYGGTGPDIRFMVSGSEHMRIIKNGNVGIGTTSPHSDLHIGSNALANKTEIRIENMGGYSLLGLARENDDIIAGSSNADLVINNTTATDIILGTDDSERMRIDSDGNVGIGTTDPNFKTSIVAGPEDTTPIALALSVDDTGLVAGQGVTLGFGQLDTVFSKIESFYQDSDGFGLKIYTGTKSTSTGTDRTKDEPSLTIDNNGNVGIGTTSPSHDLTLGSPTDTGTTSSRLKIYRGTDDPGQNLEMGYDHITVTRDANPLALDQSIFAIKQKGSDGERTVMHVDVAGNVGIGTTNPGYKLELKSLDDDWSARIVNSNNSGSGLVVNIASTSSSERIFSANSANFARFYVRADGTSFTGASTVTSDDRVKHNEQPIVGALETLGKITPKKYIKTADMYDANHDFELDADGNPIGENGESVEHRIEAGVIAQQVLTVDELAFAVSPEGVDEDGVVTSPHGLDYNSLFTYAIAAIQEQQQIINELKSQNELLAAQNVDFESRISKLEQQ
jgi:plastocyanin